MTANEIGDEGGKSMSEMLKVNTTLTTLDLCGNGRKKRERERERK